MIAHGHRDRGEPPTIPSTGLSDGTVWLRLPDDSDIPAIHAFGQDENVEATGWLPVGWTCSWQAAVAAVGDLRCGWNGRFGLALVLITVPPDAGLRGVLHMGCARP